MRGRVRTFDCEAGGSIKLFFDENLPPRIARAFDAMGIESTCVQDQGLRSKTDKEHLAFAKGGGYVLVTSDRHIKIRKHERAALLESGVCVVEVACPSTYGLWELFRVLVNKWPQIEAKMRGEDYVIVRPQSVRSLGEENRRGR